MRIKFNGKVEEIQAGSLTELLQAKKLEPQLVSVELNAEPLEPERFPATMLKEGDEVEVLLFMGGGA